MKRCPYCAEDIQDAAVVCKHCSRSLVPERKGNPAAAVVLVLLGVAVVVWWMSQGASPQAALTNAASAAAAPPPTHRDLSAAQLASVVASADERCPSATRIFFQGSDATSETWNVQCSTGKAFSVMVQSTGQTKVLACSVLKIVSKVECFKTFAEQR